MAKATYKPKATDGDGDGFVQDGTEYERPADAPETALDDVLTPPDPTPVPTTTPGTYEVQDGDSFAGIAGRYPVPGMSKHQRAIDLLAKNGGRNLRAGASINL